MLGNLEYEPSSTSPIRTRFYYNGANLLRQADYVWSGGTTTTNLTWDANHQMVRSQSGSDYRQSIYDPTASTPAALVSITSTGDVTCYVREPDGALVGSYDGSLAAYYHFDALGSTLLLSDTSGTPVNAFDYTPWGTLNYRYADAGHYQYVGKYGYYDNELDSDAALTGLLRLGVRFYDPQIGRFTQRDPIDGSVGTNLFAYAEENPLSEIDPSGKKSWRNQLCKWACLGLGTGLCCWMQASCVGVDVVTIGGAAIPCHIAATIFCGAVSGVVSLNCFSACDEYAP